MRVPRGGEGAAHFPSLDVNDELVRACVHDPGSPHVHGSGLTAGRDHLEHELARDVHTVEQHLEFPGLGKGPEVDLDEQGLVGDVEAGLRREDADHRGRVTTLSGQEEKRYHGDTGDS